MKRNRLNAAWQRERNPMAWLPLLSLLMAFVPGMLFAQSGRDYTYGTLHGASSFIDYRFERTESFSPFIDPLLVPIGWSKDGKLAYVVEHTYDGIGVGPVFVWIIQDMVSDEVLWSSKPDAEQWAAAHAETEGTPGREAFQKLFPAMREEYRPILKRYGILPGDPLELKRFPLTHAGLRHEGVIRDVTRGEAFGINDVILGYRVVATRSDKKSKTLSTVSPGRGMVLDVQVAGYLQSPFEGRIAVVLCTTTRGWEGPPNPVSYSMGGCNLKVGFK